MNFNVVLQYCRYSVLLLLAGLVVYKFFSIHVYRGRQNENIPIKLFSKYNHIEVYGTDSSAQRKFMIRSNRLTGYLWFLLIVLVLLMALPFIKSSFGI